MCLVIEWSLIDDELTVAAAAAEYLISIGFGDAMRSMTVTAVELLALLEAGVRLLLEPFVVRKAAPAPREYGLFS